MNSTRLIVLISILGIFSAFTCFAQDAGPAAPGSKALSVTTGAFAPETDVAAFYNTSELTLANNETITFRAAIHLPQGATIRALKLICRDEGAEEITLELYQTKNSGQMSRRLIVRSTGALAGTRGFLSRVKSIPADNFLNAWYLKLTLNGIGSDYGFRKAVVYYDPAP